MLGKIFQGDILLQLEVLGVIVKMVILFSEQWWEIIYLIVVWVDISGFCNQFYL